MSEEIEAVVEESRAQMASHDVSPPNVSTSFVFRPGQQIEERVEAAIERAAQLRDRAVDGVECQAGR